MNKEAAKELISEYVKVAESLLINEYGNDYTPITVAHLADELIAIDQNSAFEKEAESIRDFAFDQEIEKNAGKIADITKAIKGHLGSYKNLLTGSAAEPYEVAVSRLKGVASPAEDAMHAFKTQEAEKGLADVKKRILRARIATGGTAVVGAGGLAAGMSGE